MSKWLEVCDDTSGFDLLITFDFLSSGGATGALIPHIEKAFNFSYAKVSLLFVSTFLGYVVAAVTTGTLSRRIGFGRAMTLALAVELSGVCSCY